MACNVGRKSAAHSAACAPAGFLARTSTTCWHQPPPAGEAGNAGRRPLDNPWSQRTPVHDQQAIKILPRRRPRTTKNHGEKRECRAPHSDTCSGAAQSVSTPPRNAPWPSDFSVVIPGAEKNDPRSGRPGVTSTLWLSPRVGPNGALSSRHQVVQISAHDLQQRTRPNATKQSVGRAIGLESI